jgi:hypothetical protein
VILEWSEEVLLGMTRLVSPMSRVGGRSPVRGRRLREGAMLLERNYRVTEGGGVMPNDEVISGGQQSAKRRW